MPATNGLSLDHLLAAATDLHLLDDHRRVDRFVYLEMGRKRYFFEPEMARVFLQGLIGGYQRRVPVRQTVLVASQEHDPPLAPARRAALKVA